MAKSMWILLCLRRSIHTQIAILPEENHGDLSIKSCVKNDHRYLPVNVINPFLVANDYENYGCNFVIQLPRAFLLHNGNELPKGNDSAVLHIANPFLRRNVCGKLARNICLYSSNEKITWTGV